MARAVVIRGIRTPFNKAFGPMVELDTVSLGAQVVSALLTQSELKAEEIDSLVWGGVILPTQAPNVAREIVLDLGLPPSIEAFTVSRACASGLQAITSAASAIERGDCDIAIAGGSDSTSNAAITLPPRFIQKMGPVLMGRRSSPLDYLGALSQLSPLQDILPNMPKVAERSTGETMGQSAERMAERNEISRQAQDEFAARSHLRAAKAIEDGHFRLETTKVVTSKGKEIHTDGIVRADTSAEKLSKLRPVFKRGGTITAGNASALTDGAAAVLLMNEDKARALGYTPLATLRSWSYVGVDPQDQLLIGPAFAMPKAAAQAGLSLRDFGLVDMHEAFAAQCLSVLKALGSQAFAERRLNQPQAFGEVNPEILNVHGGSLAIGHPFAATGARMVTTIARELGRRDEQFALLGICAAGGLGAAAVLERL